ncbi:MAG TPA: hypothetical protein VGQ61_05345 [Candidatus Angelobacter sp.]|nr:hypothetical protein [Candidatus Angelobacter sp.]
MPERWEQKKKGPDLVAPALLPVINLVDRKSPSPAFCVDRIYAFGGLDFPFFENVDNLVCPSSCGGGALCSIGNGFRERT